MRTDWQEEFASRLRPRENELQWLYYELYHGDIRAYEYFTEMLYRLWNERPEKLKTADRLREASPGWYRERGFAAMQLDTGGFAGTLKGVRKKLGYIAECGVNCLYLMPLLESPEGGYDAGFAVMDYRKVRQDLGTMDDLAALADACHEKGISLCLDFAVNHTADSHEWARRARAGEKEYQDRYFFYDGWTLPTAFEQAMSRRFSPSAQGSFVWCEEAGKAVMATFGPGQWDLNYANPTVLNDMADNMLNLCNHGADIIRLDGVQYIWKALGTSCCGLPQVHSLIRILRLACEIVCPGTLLAAEIGAEPGEAVPYFGAAGRPECHLLRCTGVTAALWHTVATRDVRLLAHRLWQSFALPGEYTFVNSLGCRDGIAWDLDFGYLRQFGQEEIPHREYLGAYLTGKWPGSPARGGLFNPGPFPGNERICGTAASLCGVEAARQEGGKAAMQAAVRKDAMLHAFLFTLSGIPMLCGGDEIAQENDVSCLEDPRKRDDSRWLLCGAMDWNKAALRRRKTAPEGQLFSAVAGMARIRAAYAAFDARADRWLLKTGNDRVLGIGRYCLGQQLLALFNFGDEDAAVQLNEGMCYTDLTDGTESDALCVSVPAGGFRWLLHAY